MNETFKKLMKWASSAAMGFGMFTILGLLCRTWLYQPPIAAKLFDSEIEL